ncbi:MAG: alanine racemase [Spirochaetes bacterium]|nr:alanine racemase [Spirochaetota bacterium]
MLRPGDRGGPYTEYFTALNNELLRAGPGRPAAVIDLDMLDGNIEVMNRRLRPPLKFRLVVKSLPSLRLIRYVMERTGASRLMVFHQPDLNYLAAEGFGDVDILLGKPMPVNAVRVLYRSVRRDRGFSPERQIQWIVDTPGRLGQYLALSREMNVRMRVNIEIDVGLHRGGIRTMDELRQMLSLIEANPRYLVFSGFMGYDVHAASAPPVISSKEKAFGHAMARYRELYENGKRMYPGLFRGELTFNSGGSKTYPLFDGTGPVNDIALGSVLVKPSDFESGLMEEHQPAFFIAAPVLKRLEGVTIPFIESFSGLMEAMNPNWQVTYFIYGGGWRADYLSPAGLVDNPIYGFSTNQAIVNGSRRTALRVDDYIFFRPTQSEGIMREFGDIVVVRGGKIEGCWPAFPQ